MKKTVELLKAGFESSSGKTPEFMHFTRVFKKEFTSELKSIGATDINFSVGHFYVSGLVVSLLSMDKLIISPCLMFAGDHLNYFTVPQGITKIIQAVPIDMQKSNLIWRQTCAGILKFNN
jgi:hypothetical protein